MKQASGARQPGAVRREQIVSAVLKIIARSGVSGLTTSVLAREAGISEANLYRHFKSKDDIYLATVGQVREMISRNLDRVLAEHSDPVTVLERFFLLQVKLMEKNNGIPRLMFSEELHVHKEMREVILMTMFGVSQVLASVVREGQKDGRIRKDIDALTTVLMFLAMMQGLAFRWSLGGFSFPLGKEAVKAWSTYERMIRGGAPSPGRSV